MDKRRKLTGAGAASIAVMATLAGVPAASASSTCAECGSGQGDLPPAFLKIVHKLQAETTGVFIKLDQAFIKGFKFPAATGGVFQKIRFPPLVLKFIGGSTGVPDNVFLKIK